MRSSRRLLDVFYNNILSSFNIFVSHVVQFDFLYTAGAMNPIAMLIYFCYMLGNFFSKFSYCSIIDMISKKLTSYYSNKCLLIVVSSMCKHKCYTTMSNCCVIDFTIYFKFTLIELFDGYSASSSFFPCIINN